MAATDDATYVEHSLLTPELVERRAYQRHLADAASETHTLVCLPTGLGKTTVSLLVTAERLAAVGGTAMLLAPTKPLVRQHAEFYREALQIPDDEIVVFTGEVSPEDRGRLFETARIVIATPQVVENDLVGGRIDLSRVTHLTFDECHRASGDYAYNYIAERYHADADRPLVTAMSASPGGDEEEILRVCENLGVEEVEVMTEEDADVAEYTHGTDVDWQTIELPEEVREIRDALNEVIEDRLERLRELSVTRKTSPDVSESDLKSMRADLQQLIDNDQSEGYEGMSIHAELRKLKTAVTYVETQSVESLRRYFERQRNAARSSGASKASQRLVSEPKVREAMRKAESYDDDHPKYTRAHSLVAETLVIRGGERVIVFTESRDTAEALTEFLSEDFDVQRFVGQNDREGSEGMTQTEQAETLDRFRAGEFDVLVSTSVAEEGLDVPEVDLVLFYEPVPTAIRSIQRKGRTGRQAEGRVVVLMAEDTRDEAYFWISRRREEEMEEQLRVLMGAAVVIVSELVDEQASLEAFSEDEDGLAAKDSALADFEATDEGGNESDGAGGNADPDATVATASTDADEDATEIVVDQRETDASIARELSKREDVSVRLETLEVGDYVLSDRVVVERKSVADFLSTLTGGERSMFEQVGNAARHYARPIVVVEGDDLYGERDVHPNAVRGALASLAVDFDASVLFTDDEDDTADLLHVLAGREQQASDRTVSVHGEKSAKTLTEQQEYVVGSIADIGPVTAGALLDHFGTVEAVMTAREEDLLEVDGVGQVTAGRIREVVGSEYDG
jgi:Fanconi anemia group M protein